MEFSLPTLAIDADRYRAGVTKMMAEFQPTYFVTFVFNAAVTAKMAEADLKKFRLWLHRKITGQQGGPGTALPYIATLEHEQSNLHIHALFRVEPDLRPAFVQSAEVVWSKLRKSGNIDIQVIHDAEGVGKYMTKELRPAESHKLLLS